MLEFSVVQRCLDTEGGRLEISWRFHQICGSNYNLKFSQLPKHLFFCVCWLFCCEGAGWKEQMESGRWRCFFQRFSCCLLPASSLRRHFSLEVVFVLGVGSAWGNQEACWFRWFCGFCWFRGPEQASEWWKGHFLTASADGSLLSLSLTTVTTAEGFSRSCLWNCSCFMEVLWSCDLCWVTSALFFRSGHFKRLCVDSCSCFLLLFPPVRRSDATFISHFLNFS